MSHIALENIKQYLKYFSLASEMFIVDYTGCKFFNSGLSNPIFNFIYDIQPEADFNSNLFSIQEQLHNEQRQGVILFEPGQERYLDPKTNVLTLSRFGLVTMALPTTQTVQMPKNLSLKVIESSSDLRAWCHIADVAFDILTPGSQCYDFFLKFSDIFASDSKLHFILAELDGEPVGCSLLFQDGTTAGFYWAGVLPTARNQGVYSAMLAFRSHLATELGCTMAIGQMDLTTSFRPAQRYGFNYAGDDVLMYLLQ